MKPNEEFPSRRSNCTPLMYRTDNFFPGDNKGRRMKIPLVHVSMIVIMGVAENTRTAEKQLRKGRDSCIRGPCPINFTISVARIGCLSGPKPWTYGERQRESTVD
jgi:hypothetical protein